MKKRVCSLILACCLALTLFPSASAMSDAIGNPSSAPDDALLSLLDAYLKTILTTGTADYDDAELARWMSYDVLESAVLRVEKLSEQEITVADVDYTVTQYRAERGELVADVFETVGGETFTTTHDIRLSGNAADGWRIEADSRRDSVLPDFVSINAGTNAPRPSAGRENDWTNTGNQAVDIAQVALTQLGYAETGDNYTKYNVWFYGSNQSAPWCAIFISWCAAQAGVPESIVARNARASGFSVSNMRLNRYGAPAYAFGDKAAQCGDIAYIDNSGNEVSNHVGLVYKADSEYIYTVEGNCGDKVITRKYSTRTGRIGSSKVKIVFFARPDYANDEGPGVPAPTPSEPGMPPDVQAGTYYYDAVKWAVENSIIIRPAQNFNPDNPCTRASAVTFLWRLAGAPAPSSDENPFRDIVPVDSYYYAVLWAVERGITRGTTDTTFSPDALCNRGQIVTFLHRFAGTLPGPNVNSFADVTRGAFCYDAVSWASFLNVAQGYSDNTFRPQETCKRAQIIVFLYRYATANHEL